MSASESLPWNYSDVGTARPFENPIVKGLADQQSAAFYKLWAGQISLEDVRAVKTVLGDRWDKFSEDIVALASRDASESDGGLNGAKLMKWWDSIDPAVRSEMFSDDTHQNMVHIRSAVKMQKTTRRLLIMALYSAAIVAIIVLWHFFPVASAILFLGLVVYAAVPAGITRGLGSPHTATSDSAQAEALRTLESLEFRTYPNDMALQMIEAMETAEGTEVNKALLRLMEANLKSKKWSEVIALSGSRVESCTF
jgi:hypothetical protein